MTSATKVNWQDLQEKFCNVSSIQGFPSLFGAPVEVFASVGQQGPQRVDGQPPLGLQASIRFGSTLLLSGAPGAGKTTFALATVRAMMAHAWKNDQKTIAYYVSSEVHEDKLRENFVEFGWFMKGEEESDGAFKFWLDSKKPDETNFYAITPMPEVDRPVPSPEELVNGIFNRIAHTLLPSEAPQESAKIYVIVDSITALLKGCANAGEERRQTHEIIRRLQHRFGRKHLALVVLLAEHDHLSREERMPPVPVSAYEACMEDYLADIVFRLYVRSLPLGRRGRVLEIIKSQGANMTLGEHTWQIISGDFSSDILRLERFRKEIQERYIYRDSKLPPVAGGAVTVPKWGGIVVFPRPRLQAREMRHHEAEPPTMLDPGTEGLNLQIHPGTITLIAGPMGCSKTTLCTQFLTKDAPADKLKRVFFSFDVPGPASQSELKFTRIHFTQTQFDLNVLLAHIHWILDQDCERMAFDGLSEWITMFDRAEAARVLEAVMLTLRQPPAGKSLPAVFMTYEMPLDRDPLGPAALGTAADNVVVVRPVPIKDRHRRVIYVIKEGGKPASDPERSSLVHPSELIEEISQVGERRTKVDHTSLEAYTGLLDSSGPVQPARVLLQLFAENNAEKKFNRKLVDRLERQYAERISLTTTTFSLSELGSTLETALGAGKSGEAFNLAVHSVDEWWLKTSRTSDYLCELSAKDSIRGHSPRDFWWFETEKAIGTVLAGQQEMQSWHAIPGYMDFGMFCLNLDALSVKSRENLDKEAFPPEPPEVTHASRERRRWRSLLHKVPRRWVNTAENFPGWFEVGSASEPTVLSYGLEVTGQTAARRPNTMRKHIFTFDSSTRETCACMFFELSWAFGARESFLALGALHNSQKAVDHAAACRALLFLQFLVIEGLMPARCSSLSRNHAGEPILFSRQWYSTLQQELDNADTATSDEATLPGGLVALPFMPVGPPANCQEAGILASLLDDIAVRQHYWAGRVLKLYRQDEGAERLWKDSQRFLEMDSSRLQEKWEMAFDTYAADRSFLLQKAEQAQTQLPNAAEGLTADLDDLIELAAWAAFRLRLLLGAPAGRFPEPHSRLAALYDARWIRHCLPDLNTERVPFRLDYVIATGYVCSGSWLYGVGKKSRSSEIQTQVLAELTSLDSAQRRAKVGAGMPARKDFFYLSGENPVKGMAYLNWRELLRYGGARARRRDRVLLDPQSSPTPTKDPGPLYSVIQEELLACLRVADLRRAEYAYAFEHSDPAKAQTVITIVSQMAKQATDRIFNKASELMTREAAA